MQVVWVGLAEWMEPVLENIVLELECVPISLQKSVYDPLGQMETGPG